MKNIKRAVIFVLCLMLSAFIAWLCGYDFDTRNFLVGYMTLVSIFASGAAAFIFTENNH